MSTQYPPPRTPCPPRPAIIEEALAKEAGERFMGMPERWYDDPHWRCENGHVSTRYLKSSALGRDACLACFGWLFLTFPEDTDSTTP